MPKISLPSFRRRGGAETAAIPSLSGLDAAHHDEDARILRRTRVRLMLVSGLVTLVILGALGATVYTAVSNLIVSDSVSRLRDFAQAGKDFLPGNATPASEHMLEEQWGTRYAGVFILGWVTAPDGRNLPFVSTDPLLPGMPVQAGVSGAAGSRGDTRDIVTPRGVQLRVYTTTGQITDAQGHTYPYVIQTAADRSQEVNLLHLLLLVLLIGGGAALLLSLLAGYLYAGRALVPIRASMTRREAALQRQREFAANASHELRTPLTVIGASVEDLKRNRRSRVEDVGEALGDIDAEVSHMTALVEDLLLLARTDSGVVQVERLPVDLGDIAVEAASMLSGLGQEKAVRIEVEPLPAVVLGDQLRLRQLVTILTDNAIRHTNQGSTVRVQVHDDTTVAIMRVDDQGPGVKPEDLPRIFERFWRADDAPAGGTGLGLSIAKWIVEQHGGSIGVYNRAEGGASFWVQLPLYAPQVPQSEAPGNADSMITAAPTWEPDDDALAQEPRGSTSGLEGPSRPGDPYAG
jgi:signal transduction histidine kinase